MDATELPSEWRVKWEAYLRSAEWKAMRERVLDRFQRRCAVCNSNKGLNVHHRTYERVMHEDLNDLTLLCSACHSLFSKRFKPKRNNGSTSDFVDARTHKTHAKRLTKVQRLREERKEWEAERQRMQERVKAHDAECEDRLKRLAAEGFHVQTRGG